MTPSTTAALIKAAERAEATLNALQANIAVIDMWPQLKSDAAAIRQAIEAQQIMDEDKELLDRLAKQDDRHQRACEVLRDGMKAINECANGTRGWVQTVDFAIDTASDALTRADAILRSES